MSINILNWNMRGWRSKKAEIDKRIGEYEIFGMTETMAKSKDKIKFSGYNTYRMDRPDDQRGGGVAISVKRGIKHSIIKNIKNFSNNIESVGVKITCQNMDINVIVVYRTPGSNEKKGVWRNFFNQFRGEKNIIMGDFNAHNEEWNCYTTDTNGQRLSEESYLNDLYVVNRDTKTRIDAAGRYNSNLDLMFATEELLGIIEYTQYNDTWSSDHYPVKYKLSQQVTKHITKSNRTSNKKTDWKKYREIMQSNLNTFKEEIEESLAIPDQYTWLTEKMKETVNIASGKKVMIGMDQQKDEKTRKEYKDQGVSHNPVEWWDKECNDTIGNRKNRLRAFKISGSMEDFIKYKEARAQARKLLNKKKRENFIKFIESINKFSNMTYVWKKMRILKNASKTLEWNKWQYKDRKEEVLKTVLQLSPPWVEEKRIKVTETSVNDELNKAITIEETKRAIYNIKKDSAPGPDKIEYKMIKELPESYHEIIRDMFNNMFINTFIPEDWAKYQVVFIDKPGKEKVRPISLSSCFGKIFEKIITERINWWAEKNNKIERSQNGFRKGKSCLENIVQITVDTQVGMHENTSTLAAFLDVSAAYDNVQYSILINKLIKEGCPYRLCKYVENWMYSRKVEFIIDKEEIMERRVHKGLPQGAVLSPILYDFYTNKVVEDIPHEVRSVQFADDIAICCKNKSSNNRKAYLEMAFQKIHENLE